MPPYLQSYGIQSEFNSQYALSSATGDSLTLAGTTCIRCYDYTILILYDDYIIEQNPAFVKSPILGHRSEIGKTGSTPQGIGVPVAYQLLEVVVDAPIQKISNDHQKIKVLTTDARCDILLALYGDQLHIVQ
jgi:hypothetical protein